MKALGYLHASPAAFAFAAALALLVVNPASASHSPFLPLGDAPVVPTATNGPLDTLELRGAMNIGAVTLITLFDTTRSRSFTVSLDNTTDNGVKVSDFQGGDDSILAESGGRSRRIPLRKATIVAQAAPPPQLPGMQGMPGGMPQPVSGTNLPAPGQPINGIVPPGQPGAQVNQMSDAEVRERMQKVAEEIRRRRAARREMLEGGQPGQPQPQGASAAPQPQ